MDQPKVERLLRLMALMSGSVDYSVEELARQLETSYRSIYRYIDTFKECGFVVEKLAPNVYKLKSMPEDYPEFQNLVYFSDEEAHLVNNLIDRLDPTNALKANLQKKLSIIYDSTGIADLVDGRSLRNIVETLAKGIRCKKKVVLKNYESGNSHTVRDRFIEPFGFTTNYIDVWGFDLQDGRNKLFKLSRMEEAMLLEDEDWTNEELHEKQGLDVFGMSGRTPMRVRLSLSVMAKNLLVEEHPLAENDLSRKGDRWILDTEVYNYAGICRFYVGLASDIKIIDSPAFESYVKEYLKEYLS